MSKIESLTDGQWQDLAEFRAKMLAEGRSTEPSDWGRQCAAIAKMYEFIGIKTPIFIPAGSPLSAHLLFGVLKAKPLGQLWDQLRGQLWDQLRDQLWGQLGDQLWDQLGGQLGGQLRGQLWGQLRDQLWDQLGGQLGDQLRGQLRGQLWDQLGGQLGDQRLKIEPQRAIWAAMESYWYGYYQWCGVIKKNMYNEKQYAILKLWMDQGAGGWWYPYEGICIVTQRPNILAFNDRGQLHSDKGPAARYVDGWSLWFWNGVAVTQQIIEKPETITAEQIKTEKNAEVRRIMIERMGESKYLHETQAKLIDADYEGVKQGAAPRALLQDMFDDKWMVAADGSTEARTYYLPVPEDVKTCAEAHVSICGFDEKRILVKS